MTSQFDTLLPRLSSRFLQRGLLHASFKMAARQWLRTFTRPVVNPKICRCCISKYSTLGNGRKVSKALPIQWVKVARYYEKPKEKKGTAGGWAFLAGATSGILIGAVAYLGNYKLESINIFCCLPSFYVICAGLLPLIRNQGIIFSLFISLSPVSITWQFSTRSRKCTSYYPGVQECIYKNKCAHLSVYQIYH